MENATTTKFKLKLIYKILLVMLLSVSFLLLWSRYISTSGLMVKEYKVVNKNLPIHFHGLKIVHFSDLHYGRTINEKELIKIVDKINIIKPDLVFFTGDLVDRDVKPTTKMENIIINNLSRITSTYGKYAINGNHDMVFKDYQSVISKSGFVNISNSFDVIYNKYYEPILIGGLETGIAGHSDASKIEEYLKTADKNMYKILLMHTPDTFDKIRKDNFDLVLAGHSHNGQIRLPFIGKIVTPPGAKKYYEAYYKIDNTDFYISGGLGTSTVNFRFFDKPSFNFYRLTEK